MKKTLLLTFLLVFLSSLQAQNDLEIGSIRKPEFNFNYSVNDSIDVEVTFFNNGPNTIIATDIIYFDVKVANPDTTIFFSIDKVASANITPGNAAVYTLIQNLPLNTQNNYSVCVSIRGTNIYPTNTSKEPGPCVSFPVGLEERELKAERLIYNEGLLTFYMLEVPKDAYAAIMDMSGKVIQSAELRSEKEQSVRFIPPAGGLYFLKVADLSGQQSTHKFIVR